MREYVPNGNARMVSYMVQRGLHDHDFAEPGETPPLSKSTVMLELAFDSPAEALEWLVAQARFCSGCVAANVVQDIAPLLRPRS